MRRATEINPVLAFFGRSDLDALAVAMWPEEDVEGLFQLKAELEAKAIPGAVFLHSLAVALAPPPPKKPKAPKAAPPPHSKNDVIREIARCLRVASSTIERLAEAEAEAEAEAAPKVRRPRRSSKNVEPTDEQRAEARDVLRKLGGRL